MIRTRIIPRIPTSKPLLQTLVIHITTTASPTRIIRHETLAPLLCETLLLTRLPILYAILVVDDVVGEEIRSEGACDAAPGVGCWGRAEEGCCTGVWVGGRGAGCGWEGGSAGHRATEGGCGDYFCVGLEEGRAEGDGREGLWSIFESQPPQVSNRFQIVAYG